MNGKMKHFKAMLLPASLLVVGLILVNSCKKSEPTSPPETEPQEEVASAAIEQTICPVMAGAIDKSIFTEYQGKKVYFCCAGCKDKFEAEPEKYLAKLPQFKQ